VLDGHDATVRSDIYALAVLLYHLVTNDYPIRAKSLDELRVAHGENRRGACTTPGRTACPTAWYASSSAPPIVARTRYATAGEMQSDLVQAGGIGLRTPVPGLVPPSNVPAPTATATLGALLQRPACSPPPPCVPQCAAARAWSASPGVQPPPCAGAAHDQRGPLERVRASSSIRRTMLRRHPSVLRYVGALDHRDQHLMDAPVNIVPPDTARCLTPL